MGLHRGSGPSGDGRVGRGRRRIRCRGRGSLARAGGLCLLLFPGVFVKADVGAVPCFLAPMADFAVMAAGFLRVLRRAATEAFSGHLLHP